MNFNLVEKKKFGTSNPRMVWSNLRISAVVFTAYRCFLGFASKTLHEFRFSLSYQLQDVYELLTFPLSVFTVQDYHTEDFPHNNVITLYWFKFSFLSPISSTHSSNGIKGDDPTTFWISTVIKAKVVISWRDVKLYSYTFLPRSKKELHSDAASLSLHKWGW